MADQIHHPDLAESVGSDWIARSADGVDVATEGPWDRYTVLAIRPTGAFLRYASAWRVLSPIAIAAAETATLDIRVRADEPSDEQFTFSVREAGFLVTH